MENPLRGRGGGLQPGGSGWEELDPPAPAVLAPDNPLPSHGIPSSIEEGSRLTWSYAEHFVLFSNRRFSVKRAVPCWPAVP